jgi:hypothetical protein
MNPTKKDETFTLCFLFLASIQLLLADLTNQPLHTYLADHQNQTSGRK